MGGSITLVCRGCGRRMPYFRSNDPSLPAWVETISMSACDLCHDGDRMSEDWLDADGNAPDPDTMPAPTRATTEQSARPREANESLPAPTEGVGETPAGA